VVATRFASVAISRTVTDAPLTAAPVVSSTFPEMDAATCAHIIAGDASSTINPKKKLASQIREAAIPLVCCFWSTLGPQLKNGVTAKTERSEKLSPSTPLSASTCGSAGLHPGVRGTS
jgi:hypothetical protein